LFFRASSSLATEPYRRACYNFGAVKARFTLLLLLGLWLALTPPGLCPCWLLPGNVHPHARPAESDTPHTHEDLGQSQSSQTVPPVSLPALLSGILILLIPLDSLWLRLASGRRSEPLQVEPSPLRPPPRLLEQTAIA